MRFQERFQIETKQHEEIIKQLEGKGQTVIAVSVNKNLTGLLSLADTIKQDAKEAVSYIKDLNIKPIMITGDNEITVKIAAEQLGIERVIAQVLPDDTKLQSMVY